MASTRVLTATVRAVKRAKITPSRAPIVLTPAAVSRVKTLMEGKPDTQGLKIGVKTRGCNGLSYTLDYTTTKGKFDEEVEQDGVRIIIDSRALMGILGTEMDYVENKLESSFVFNNPNIKGTCGCGESFNIS